MPEEAFQIAKEVIAKIEMNGHQAYFVGGCVRDLLLKREIGDIDITTSAPPDVIQKIFDHVIPIGIEHGTVMVVHRRQSFEVTTFRSEGTYSDQRHPDQVAFIDTLDEDLKRRDFTMNAIAMNKDGEIIDLFAGERDLQEKLIRTVGDSTERFMEDPLRMLRALRFSSQLGFHIEEKTLQAIMALKKEIASVAVERITNEMSKLLAGNEVNMAFAYIRKTGIHKYFPVFDRYHDLIYKIPELMKPLTSISGFIAMLHLLAPEISIMEWVKDWKCSNKIKQDASILANILSIYEKNGLDPWLVYQLPDHLQQEFTSAAGMLFRDQTCTVSRLAKMKKNLPIASRKELAISGNDIVQLFPEREKGPWIQTLLNRLVKAVVMGELNNTKNDLKEWIKWNPPENN